MIWPLVAISASSLITCPLVRLEAAEVFTLSLSLASGPLHMQLPQDEMLPTSLGVPHVNSFFRGQLSHSLFQEAFSDNLLFFGWIFSGSRTTLIPPLPLIWLGRLWLVVAKALSRQQGDLGSPFFPQCLPLRSCGTLVKSLLFSRHWMME